MALDGKFEDGFGIEDIVDVLNDTDSYYHIKVKYINNAQDHFNVKLGCIYINYVMLTSIQILYFTLHDDKICTYKYYDNN